MSAYKVLAAGDTALVFEFGDGIDRAVNEVVLGLAARLREATLDGVVEIVPTFRSLLVQFDPARLSADRVIRHVDALMSVRRVAPTHARQWRLPVCYDAELAPDLADVAARTGLSPAQAIEQHSAVAYRVYMIGFLPGQAYLGDVPATLALPRREVPRTRIPAGSVGMAMTMTCIFPLESPCGWHLIGRSPVRLWEPGSTPLLAPGDSVSLAPVSLREFESLAARAAAGQLALAPVEAKEAA